MMGRTHQLLGATLTAGTYIALGAPALSLDFGLGLAISMLASVLPDIDGDSGRVGRIRGDPMPRTMMGIGNRQTRWRVRGAWKRLWRSPGLGVALARFFVWLYHLFWRQVAVLVNLASRLLGHRGVTHWGITWLALSLLAFVAAHSSQGFTSAYLEYPLLPALAFSISYGSHLLGDMTTRSGVTVLFPFSSRRYHILPEGMRLRTGSWFETRLFWFWAIALALVAAIYLVNVEGIL
ncbi:MAG: metal-dependent hydrolase [Chloroflexi bacterium]|nr:metal-dependent hydrolase [Chloroflexota bacterium]MCI0577061.1 metal-dependent hydrolase [Chloroflexota bacterium]MCI0643531.1 metal-dependent hydrolase [Chloroflexota bacterium]MCI0728141.1 metal-dependent hydrolase [Chloroflexota bacterium]